MRFFFIIMLIAGICIGYFGWYSNPEVDLYAGFVRETVCRLAKVDARQDAAFVAPRFRRIA